jgi:outer membrane receptor for monomeric catechols
VREVHIFLGFNVKKNVKKKLGRNYLFTKEYFDKVKNGTKIAL